MSYRVITGFVAFVAACTPAPRATAPASPPASGGRVVVVSVDGLMPDAYLDPDAHGLKIPTLRSLVARGAAGRVRGVMPTVTYPSHTTMVTGVPPRVHGIFANRPLDPLGKNLDGWRWYAEDIKVPTLYQRVEEQHRQAALIVWPVSVGAKVSVNVPEFWRAGTVDDQKLQRAISTPGLLDEVAHAHPDLWRDLAPPHNRDHGQFTIARHVLATRHPDLVMVHVFELDDAQHEHGPWSDEAKATMEAVDHELGELLADLERSPEWPRTTFVVVSDHGFAPISTEIRLGALLVKHDLVRLDKDGKPAQADVAVLPDSGTAFVYVLDPKKQPQLDAAIAELGDRATRVEHDKVVELGGNPEASFALVAAPGFAFSGKLDGDVVVDVGTRGTHGWPPTDPAMAASLVAYGPHVPHVSLGTVDMTQLAPTFARLLGVELETATSPAIEPLIRR